LPRFTKTWVVRLFGAFVAANVIVPATFECFTGSSGIVAFAHFCATEGLGAMPNCTTNPGITRKSRFPS
jgi:hypothetical protein